jgi:hypothetical protein
MSKSEIKIINDRMLNVRVPNYLKVKLQDAASSNKVSVSKLIRYSLDKLDI